jgi:hypothetical protein
MRSFIAYPLDVEKLLFPEIADRAFSASLIAHYELYKKVCHLQGAVINCGIAAEESFTRFAMLRNLIATHSDEKVIAFEKYTKSLYFDNSNEDEGVLQYKVKRSMLDVERLQVKLQKKGMLAKIEFVQGYLEDSIPEYLIENPELKIAYLNIDLDDYEATFTTLQFFYPRMVNGGILVFDNYYKKEEDFKAISDYFRFNLVPISSYSVNKGPHYVAT